MAIFFLNVVISSLLFRIGNDVLKTYHRNNFFFARMYACKRKAKEAESREEG